MKTAHKKSSHAKRQQRDNFALWKVVARSTGFNQAEQTDCTLPVRIAWESLRSGSANEIDIQTLADVVAICFVATEHMDPFIQQICVAARDAVCAIVNRFTRIKQWGVDADALRDIPLLIDLYEELMRHATGGQAQQWLLTVSKIKC